MNVVTGAKRVSFIVDLSVVDGGPTTMKLCGKIVDFGAMYEASFAALMDAVKRKDTESIKVHFDAVVYFEMMQRQAAITTRSHLLERVRGK